MASNGGPGSKCAPHPAGGWSASPRRSIRKRRIGGPSPSGFTETIQHGAFAASLARVGSDVLALLDHDPSRLLARQSSGTLRLLEQRDGLAYDIALPATTLASDLLALVERGDVEGMSFGFRPVKEDWPARDRRVLVACDLVEISVIQAHAAYAATSVQARSADAQAQAAARWRRQFVDTL